MYFDRENVRDALLKGMLSEEDIDESTDYVNNLAARLGVKPEEIAEPISYPVEKLALYYALMICAENASKPTAKDGEAKDDPYEKKRALYEERVRYWERQITRETFVGFAGKSAGEFMPLTIGVSRS